MANYNNAAAAKNPPWQQQAISIGSQQQNVLNSGLLQYPQTALLQAQQLIQNQTSMLQYPNQQQQYGNAASTTAGYNQIAAASNVTYPTRHLNSTAFATPSTGVMNSGATSQGLMGAGQGLLGQSPTTFPKQRVFTGTVTKRQDNFGFVDEDVFFQVDVCSKGANPRLGDKVLVEAAYNPSMPFKWNATRIQVLPMEKDRNQGYSRFSNGPSRYSPQPGDDFKRRGGNTNSLADRNRGPIGFNRNRSPDRSSDRKRRFDALTKDDGSRTRSPKRDDEKRDRDRSPSRRDSSVGRKSRSTSPKRRRTRPVARYAVSVPKFTLDLTQADLLELRRRYQNMYIPSDFFISASVWLEAFPPDRPFSLQHPAAFHIMSKDVEPYLANTAELDPPDADYLFSAKVMLLSMPKLEEVFKKCVTLGEELNDKDYKNVVHPSRLINFLVGMRGKSETMAIGGPWSESLDGANPDKDPGVLIKTAIRTTRALTGIDLSKCTKWFKFLELYYRRQETTHKGKPVAARVETVVIYVPDVWNCVPTQLEWDGLTVNYKKMYTAKISTKTEESAVKSADDEKDATMEEDTSVVKKEPTHYSLLDMKNMKAQDLRDELEARSLSNKGLKSQLTARLAKALKIEQAADDVKGEAEDEEEEDKEEEKKDEKKEDGDNNEGDGEKKDEGMSEKEKQRLERKYTLPELPSVLVHPSSTAKNGKFQCEVMSLSLLLDYRIDDAKEHSFEVACFAELFNEMLMRDFGFQIFKAIHNAPEPVKEEKEDKKEKSKTDEDKTEDAKDAKDKESADKEADKKDKDDESKDKEDKDEKKEKEKEKKERERKREEREKRREKEKQKFYTENPFLLLCCAYFDTTSIGYMYDKDLEDLLLTLGLSLSRSQVKKLVQKVLVREKFNYRELTDKVVVEGVEKTLLNEIKLDIELLKQLIEGNKKFLPVFIDPTSVGKSPRKGSKTSSAVMDNGLVMYQGSLVDIGNLQTSLEKSDVARSYSETALFKLRSEYSSLEKQSNKLKEKLEKTANQLVRTTKELIETQTKHAETTETKEELMKALEDIHRRVDVFIAKPAKMEVKNTKVEVKNEEGEEQMDESEKMENGEAVVNGGEESVKTEEELKGEVSEPMEQ